MFCANCGSKMNDGDVFCPECGARLEIQSQQNTQQQNTQQRNTQQQYTQQQYTQQQYTQQQYNQQQYNQQQYNQQQYTQQQYGQPKADIKLKTPHKTPKLPIFIGAGAVIVAGATAAVLNLDRVTNFVHKQFSSPTEYYQYIEEKSVSELASSAAAIYDATFLDNVDLSNHNIEGAVTLEFGDGAKKYLDMAKSAGIDLSWLESAGFTLQTKGDGDLASMDAQAILNNVDVLSYSAIMDVENACLYIQVPEITEQYIGINLNDWFEDLDVELAEVLELQDMSEELIDALPDEEEVNKLVEKYLLVAIKSVNNVSKVSTTVKAQGVSQKCTELRYTLDTNDIAKIMENMLKEIKKDSDIEDIFKDIVKASGSEYDEDDLYTEFIYSIEEVLDELSDIDYEDDEDDDLELNISVFVNGKGEIIGRSLEYDNEYDEHYTLSRIMTQNGNNFGYELQFLYEDDYDDYMDTAYAKLVGSGTYKSGTITGKYSVVYKEDFYDNEYEIADLSISNLDVKELKKGYLNGSFEFTLGKDISEMASYYSVSPDFKITLTSTMSEGNFDWIIGLEYGGEDLGTLDISSKTVNSSTVKIPDSKKTVMVTNDYDLVEWMQGISLKQLIKNLKSAGVPQDWLNDLEDISESIEDGDLYNLFMY